MIEETFLERKNKRVSDVKKNGPASKQDSQLRLSSLSDLLLILVDLLG